MLKIVASFVCPLKIIIETAVMAINQCTDGRSSTFGLSLSQTNGRCASLLRLRAELKRAHATQEAINVGTEAMQTCFTMRADPGVDLNVVEEKNLW